MRQHFCILEIAFQDSFSFEHEMCTPSPNFSTDLAFLRKWFSLWRWGGGGRTLAYKPLSVCHHHITLITS